MDISNAITNVVSDLQQLLLQLTNEQYTAPSRFLSGATTGQHTRHIIELFRCLFAGYETGLVNYDRRKRDMETECSREKAQQLLAEVASSATWTDRLLVLETGINGDGKVVTIPTSFARELLYNLEHTVHHMALIRVGIMELTDISLPVNFGVAQSTIQYRKACAQ